MSERKRQVLHVAPPRGCNTQHSGGTAQQGMQREGQQQSLKALAQRALERNGKCNSDATSAEKPCNNWPPEDADLLHALERSCEGLPVTPSEVRAAMSDDDVRDWRAGKITDANLTAFARWWVANRSWARRHPAFAEGKS